MALARISSEAPMTELENLAGDELVARACRCSSRHTGDAEHEVSVAVGTSRPACLPARWQVPGSPRPPGRGPGDLSGGRTKKGERRSVLRRPRTPRPWTPTFSGYGVHISHVISLPRVSGKPPESGPEPPARARGGRGGARRRIPGGGTVIAEIQTDGVQVGRLAPGRGAGLRYQLAKSSVSHSQPWAGSKTTSTPTMVPWVVRMLSRWSSLGGVSSNIRNSTARAPSVDCSE